MRTTKQPSLIHPKHWPTWLMFGLLRVLAFLPYRPLMAVGRFIGHLFRHFAKRRRHIAETNLRLCFPEWSEQQVQKMLRQYFASVGMGLMDFLIAWWWSDQRIQTLYEVQGAENLNSVTDQQGTIFYTVHMSSIELSGRLLLRHAPASVMYRPNENPVTQFVIQRMREHHTGGQVIARDNIRLMLKTLRSKKGVWFAPDQNYGHKHSVFADFFGVPAATNTSTSRFADLTGATVIPFVAVRRPEGGYRLVIEPPLANFPSGDAKQDTQRLNDIAERWIREVPEQYNWMHRRFKDRPNNEPRFY